MAVDIHQRVRELFDNAVVLPKPDRQHFLETEACGNAAVLQGVLRLLEAHDQSPYFLDNDTRRSPRLGRYILTGELGRGAMGIVYKAIDPLIGRSVAIKTVRLQAISDIDDAEFKREALLREARSAGVLSHPGIVIIFDVGQEGDTTFIAMERVEGTTLQRVMESGPKPDVAKVLDILRQTAEALDYAHLNGVVHRDVKPANIMLHKGASVKIADFGIAKIACAQHQTLTGMVMGTPIYMSPEQIEAKPVDGRSDQFALAVVAYELLTGGKPFAGDSLISLAHNIVHGSRPSARLLNPALPPAIDDALGKALSRLPQERYATCVAFVDALAQVFQDSAKPLPAAVSVPVAVAQPSAPQPARVPPAFLIAAAGLSVLFVSAILYKLLAPAPTAPIKTPPAVNLPAAAVPPPSPSPSAPRILAFHAEPARLKRGEPFRLNWNVEGASKVTIDGGVGVVADSGNRTLVADASTTYTLSVTGSGGTASAQTTIAVSNPAPPAASAAAPTAPVPTPPPAVDSGASASQLYYEAMAKRSANQTSASLALLRKSADLGDPRAMLELGKSYRNGEGLERNPGEAVRWFQKAADAGNTAAMVDLGKMYALGAGVDRSDTQAVRWYRQAAVAGNNAGMDALGQMLASGRGVPKDDAKAANWFRRSAQAGNLAAKSHLDELQASARVAPPSGGGVTVMIPVNRAWTDTGVKVNLGDLVTVSAKGDVQVSRNGKVHAQSPAGDSRTCRMIFGPQATVFPMPQRACWCLIARVGLVGASYEIGNANTFEARKSGRLFLGVNADLVDSNSGSWTALIAVKPGH